MMINFAMVKNIPVIPYEYNSLCIRAMKYKSLCVTCAMNMCYKVVF